MIYKIKYSSPVVANCEDGWEEEGGKCYFFSQERYTWVRAEEECKNKGSHLASVTDQQTHDFIARRTKKGKGTWIGARQAFQTDQGTWVGADAFIFNKGGEESSWFQRRKPFDRDNIGSWAWADGCSTWKHTSWTELFNPDGVLEYECAFLAKSIDNIETWRAAKCDKTGIQFRYVCSTTICPNVTSITPAKDAKDASITPALDPITTSPITIVLDQTTIAVGIAILVGLLLLIVVAVFIFKKLKQKQREPTPMKTEGNALYGLYYSDDGERIDQGRAYAEDHNPGYYS